MTMILESANTTTWQILSEEGDYTGNTWNLDIDTAGTFTLITNGAIDAFVAWGDGTSERLTATSGTSNFTHTYSPTGTYTVQLQLLSGDFRPYYNNSAAGDELVTLGDTPVGWSFGTDLRNAFFGSNNLTTIGDIDTSSVIQFGFAWLGCTGLTSFPLLDTSSGTDFGYTWYDCTSLTSFPQIDTSSGTYFLRAWANCSGLTSFPALDVSSGDTFYAAWNGCTSLTSFPVLDISNGTNFFEAWRNCRSLTSFPEFPTGKKPVAATTFELAWFNCDSLETFPENFFDDWTGTPADNCFVNTWDLCSALTATSVENILNSIAASAGQQNAPATGPDITIDYDATSGTPDIAAAVATLKGRSPAWTITLNGVAQ